MDNGWISLNRSLLDHWIWKDSDELSKAEAWIYLLMAANHSEEPKKIVIKDKVLMCGRGESLRSLETLSKDWNWNRSKVRRFLKVLEKENMIRHASETVTRRISICNYDTYQINKSESETHLKRKRNAFETHSTTNNNGNNENKNVFVEKNCEEQQRKIIFQKNKGYFNGREFDKLWEKFVWVCEQNGVAFSETRWNTFTKNK